MQRNNDDYLAWAFVSGFFLALMAGSVLGAYALLIPAAFIGTTWVALRLTER